MLTINLNIPTKDHFVITGVNICILFFGYVPNTFLPLPNSNSSLTQLGDFPFAHDIFEGWGRRVKRDQGRVEVKAMEKVGIQRKKLLG